MAILNCEDVGTGEDIIAQINENTVNIEDLQSQLTTAQETIETLTTELALKANKDQGEWNDVSPNSPFTTNGGTFSLKWRLTEFGTVQITGEVYLPAGNAIPSYLVFAKIDVDNDIYVKMTNRISIPLAFASFVTLPDNIDDVTPSVVARAGTLDEVWLYYEFMDNSTSKTFTNGMSLFVNGEIFLY